MPLLKTTLKPLKNLSAKTNKWLGAAGNWLEKGYPAVLKAKEYLKMILFGVLVILSLKILMEVGDSEQALQENDLVKRVGREVVDRLKEEEKAVEEEDAGEEGETSDCNVMEIELLGDIITYAPDNDTALFNESYPNGWVSSYDMIEQINEAKNNEDIKAIILQVDSCGGLPVATEEIANALAAAGKPTVAWIRQSGTSGAYWAAAGADTIFASAMSDVGGIGVTASFLDYSRKNQLEGATYNSLNTGKYKDMGNPDKPLTPEEKALIQRDLNATNDIFIKYVSQRRRLSEAKVRALADGSTMLGQQALKAGLVDRLGGPKQVNEFLRTKLNEDIRVCGY